MSKKHFIGERRYLLQLSDDQKSAVRAEKDKDGKRYFVGYAAVFDKRSKLIWDWDRVFYEIIKPGAFDSVLNNEKVDIPLVTNHERYKVLARTVSGNLVLSVDETGLHFRALVPDTTLGNDTWVMIERGDYTDCSLYFRMEESGSKWYRDGEDLIHEVHDILDVMDLTICSFQGAYSETEIDTEVASRMYDKLIREGSESDKDTGGGSSGGSAGGTSQTPEEKAAAEAEKVEASITDKEMELELMQMDSGIATDK